MPMPFNLCRVYLNNTRCATFKTNFHSHWIRHYLFYGMKIINIKCRHRPVLGWIDRRRKWKPSVCMKLLPDAKGMRPLRFIKMVNSRLKLRWHVSPLINTTQKCDTAPKMDVCLFFFCQGENVIECFKFRIFNDFSEMECDTICFSLSKQL